MSERGGVWWVIPPLSVVVVDREHVLVGQVVGGMEHVLNMEQVKRDRFDTPMTKINIRDSGELLPEKQQRQRRPVAAETPAGEQGGAHTESEAPCAGTAAEERLDGNL